MYPRSFETMDLKSFDTIDLRSVETINLRKTMEFWNHGFLKLLDLWSFGTMNQRNHVI